MYRGALFNACPVPGEGAGQAFDEGTPMRTKLIAATATLLLFTTACGSDDSSDSASDETTAEASSDEGGASDRAGQIDSIVSTFVSSGLEEECVRNVVNTMSDADIAIVATNADEMLTDAGQQAMGAINECPKTGG